MNCKAGVLQKKKDCKAGEGDIIISVIKKILNYLAFYFDQMNYFVIQSEKEKYSKAQHFELQKLLINFIRVLGLNDTIF